MRPQALLAFSLIAVLSAPVFAQCSRDEEFQDSAAVSVKDLKDKAKGQAAAAGKPAQAEKKAEEPKQEAKKAEPPAAPVCEAALKKANISATPWMVTKKAVYVYHEDCDICAELDRCDLETGKISEVVVAHSVSCSDMDKYRSEGVVWEDCGRR